MKLEFFNSVDTPTSLFTVGTTAAASPLRLPLDGLFVVADGTAHDTGTLVPNADMVLGLADTLDDNVSVVLSLNGTELDRLGYGPQSTRPEGTAATDLNPDRTGFSLSRNGASVDSGDNADDFHLDPTPTPGLPNDLVEPKLLSYTPKHGLATGATTITVTARDFADHLELDGVSGSGRPVTFVLGAAGLPIPCTITAIADAGRDTSTWTCTIPDRGGTPERITIAFLNGAWQPAHVQFIDGWTWTGVANETGTAGEADYCNLQWPPSFSSTAADGSSPEVYARIFEAGTTEAGGALTGVLAELGVGPASSDPTAVNWSWYPAQFNVQVGNDDEYVGTFPLPPAGASYAYTYRFSLDDGILWTYCDLNGAGSNGGLTFETGQLGTATVTP